MGHHYNNGNNLRLAYGFGIDVEQPRTHAFTQQQPRFFSRPSGVDDEDTNDQCIACPKSGFPDRTAANSNHKHPWMVNPPHKQVQAKDTKGTLRKQGTHVSVRGDGCGLGLQTDCPRFFGGGRRASPRCRACRPPAPARRTLFDSLSRAVSQKGETAVGRMLDPLAGARNKKLGRILTPALGFRVQCG